MFEPRTIASLLDGDAIPFEASSVTTLASKV